MEVPIPREADGHYDGSLTEGAPHARRPDPRPPGIGAPGRGISGRTATARGRWREGGPGLRRGPRDLLRGIPGWGPDVLGAGPGTEPGASGPRAPPGSARRPDRAGGGGHGDPGRGT